MFLFVSCSLDDDSQSFYNEAIPIASITVPEVFEFGNVYPISVTYFRPTGCHIFNSFLFENNNNERTVILVNTVYQDQNCETFGPEEIIEEASFNFQVNEYGTHTFKFWQGEDANGNDLYYIVDIPVAE